MARLINRHFTLNEQKYLLNNGYKEEDFPQIAFTRDNIIITNEKGKIISNNRAKRLLGGNKFITGVARASFHGTATRYYGNNSKGILFEDKIPMFTNIPSKYNNISVYESELLSYKKEIKKLWNNLATSIFNLLNNGIDFNQEYILDKQINLFKMYIPKPELDKRNLFDIPMLAKISAEHVFDKIIRLALTYQGYFVYYSFSVDYDYGYRTENFDTIIPNRMITIEELQTILSILVENRIR